MGMMNFLFSHVRNTRPTRIHTSWRTGPPPEAQRHVTGGAYTVHVSVTTLYWWCVHWRTAVYHVISRPVSRQPTPSFVNRRALSGAGRLSLLWIALLCRRLISRTRVMRCECGHLDDSAHRRRQCAVAVSLRLAMPRGERCRGAFGASDSPAARRLSRPF